MKPLFKISRYTRRHAKLDLTGKAKVYRITSGLVVAVGWHGGDDVIAIDGDIVLKALAHLYGLLIRRFVHHNREGYQPGRIAFVDGASVGAHIVDVLCVTIGGFNLHTNVFGAVVEHPRPGAFVVAFVAAAHGQHTHTRKGCGQIVFDCFHFYVYIYIKFPTHQAFRYRPVFNWLLVSNCTYIIN